MAVSVLDFAGSISEKTQLEQLENVRTLEPPTNANKPAHCPTEVFGAPELYKEANIYIKWSLFGSERAVDGRGN